MSEQPDCEGTLRNVRRALGTPEGVDIVAHAHALRTAVVTAAETFDDAAKMSRMLGRDVLAEAYTIAATAMRKALAG